MRLSLGILCLGGLGLAGMAVPRSWDGNLATPYIYVEAAKWVPDAWSEGGERFPEGARLILVRGSERAVMAPGFFAAADPEISFDAQRLLFAGRRTREDTWGIWEASLSGGVPRRVFESPDDCIRPLYLPEETIVYARHTEAGWQIETRSLRSGKSLRLTYAPGNFLPDAVLRDGRVLFETNGEIFTVYSDGSGVESYRCDHGRVRREARQLASGDIVFEDAGGFGRFTSALATEVPLRTPPGIFAGPVAEVDAHEWLVAWRARRDGRFGLFAWTPGATHLRKVASGESEMIGPTIVAPRPVPKRFPSALHNWDGANVLCLNAYTSKLAIAEGAIGSVRLYSEGPDRRQVLLGETGVEEDGSFFLHVPGDRPLKLELLDRSGKRLAGEHNWFWLRQGEQRVCVGCHAGPERAPENATPKVLSRSDVPVHLPPLNGVKGGGTQ